MKYFLILMLVFVAYESRAQENPAVIDPEYAQEEAKPDENELNDAQIFEKKMLENRKMRKSRKTTVYNVSGTHKTHSQSNKKGSSKGKLHSTPMNTSVRGGMFVK